MKLPRFTTTLHFRIPALFLLLLSAGAGLFYLWIDNTVLSLNMGQDEEDWYENRAEVEMDSLAVELAGCLDDPERVAARVQAYGQAVAAYDCEVVAFDAAGRHLASSNPDSLQVAVSHTDPELLLDMTDGEWDFGSYPVPGSIDAYENRIFEINRLYAGADSSAAPFGFLALSFRPITIPVDELGSGPRTLGLQAIVILLVTTALSGLIILTWTSRRIVRLSEGVAAFAAGDLGLRVKARSSDEIGLLGRNFNMMAERIEGMVDQLTQGEQFQRQLIANISHDLRTPLSSLRGYVETLSLRAEELDVGQRRRFLEIITDNLDHLDRLIEHTLVLSKIDSGQTVFHAEDFHAQELGDSVLQRCEALARGRGVTLRVAADPGLPQVHADPLQIALVLQNLIENGIKFNRPGGEVVLTLERSGERVACTVRDDGTGIAAQDLPHIFDRFYTGNHSRTRDGAAVAPRPGDHLGQSSGLGLAIAERIVSAHGSALTVRSEPGRGSEFRFELPVGDRGERAQA